jgi:hypothetical protein
MINSLTEPRKSQKVADNVISLFGRHSGILSRIPVIYGKTFMVEPSYVRRIRYRNMYTLTSPRTECADPILGITMAAVQKGVIGVAIVFILISSQVFAFSSVGM